MPLPLQALLLVMPKLIHLIPPRPHHALAHALPSPPLLRKPKDRLPILPRINNPTLTQPPLQRTRRKRIRIPQLFKPDDLILADPILERDQARQDGDFQFCGEEGAVEDVGFEEERGWV